MDKTAKLVIYRNVLGNKNIADHDLIGVKLFFGINRI